MGKQGDGQHENEEAYQNLQKQRFLAGHGKPIPCALPETVPQVIQQPRRGMGTDLVGRVVNRSYRHKWDRFEFRS